MYPCETTFMYVCETTFMYTCETTFMYVCETTFINAFSNAKMSYISNVDLDEWNKIAIHDFRSWGRLGSRKRACSNENWKFQNLSGPNHLR
jgi:hypothetical protein